MKPAMRRVSHVTDDVISDERIRREVDIIYNDIGEVIDGKPASAILTVIGILIGEVHRGKSLEILDKTLVEIKLLAQEVMNQQLKGRH